MVKNKKLLLISLIFFQNGFAQKLTLDAINSPSKKFFLKELQQQINDYKQFPEISKNIKETEEQSFNARIRYRNIALKKINNIENKTLIIIDKFRTNYSGLLEENFIFIDNNEFYTNIIQSEIHISKRLIKKKKLNVDYIDDDVLKVLHIFTSKNIDLKNENLKNKFDTIAKATFYITLVKNRKVKYYYTSFQKGSVFLQCE
jgi:hypothetical protein